MVDYRQLAEEARRRGRIPPVANTPTAQPRVPVTQSAPRPVSGGGAGRSGGARPGDAYRALMSSGSGQAAPKESGGGGGLWDGMSSVAGAVGGGIMDILNVVDAPVRGLQAAAGEVGDFVEGADWIPGGEYGDFVANTLGGNVFQLRGLKDEEGNRDTSFDLGAITDNVFNGDVGSGHFQARTDWDESLPGWAQAVVGFAGDLTTDPTTYVGAGAVKNVVKPGVKAAAGTVIPAARTTLASEAALRAAKEFGPEALENPAVRKVLEQAGSKGRGAFTPRNIAEQGLDENVINKLDLKPDFGLQLRAGPSAVNIPGTKTLAEATEYAKSGVKAAVGGSAAGRITRQLFTSAELGERAAKNAVLSGAKTAPEGAAALAAIRMGRAKAHTWVGEAAHSMKQIEGRDLRGNKNRARRTEITAALDGVATKDITDDLARQIRGWFDDQAEALNKAGAQFKYREGYLPHRLSRQAHRNLKAGDQSVAAEVGEDLAGAERFQKLRASNETIAERNARWRETHDYDLLETDIEELVGDYLNEGQEAIMRANFIGNRAEDLGMVKAPTKTVGTEDMVRDAEVELDKAVKARRGQVKAATDNARAVKADAASEFNRISKEIGEANQRAVKAQKDFDAAGSRLKASEAALRLKEEAAEGLRGAERRQLDAQLERLRGDIARFRSQQATATRRYNAAKFERGELGEAQKVAKAELDTHKATINSLETDRVLMDVQRDSLKTPATEAGFSKNVERAESVVETAARNTDEAREKFVAASGRKETADDVLQWLAADGVARQDRISGEISNIQSWIRRQPKMPKSKHAKLRLEYARELEDHLSVYRSIIGDDEMSDTAKLIATLDAQATTAEFHHMRLQDAANVMVRKDDFNAMADILGNPNFQKYISETADEGFEMLRRQGLSGDPEDLQINAAYREMFDPKAPAKVIAERGEMFKAFQKAVYGYQKALSWWKGWALGTPGFVIRNLYSGMFNAYLDGVPQSAVARFGRFNRVMDKAATPEEGLAIATRKWPKDVDNLMKAREAAAATGWGITREEGKGKLVGEVWSPNPLSNDFAPLMAIREASSLVEASLRGGHALAILERGGGFDEAVERVTKFHFNYRDVSEFDRKAKMVSPFWTFFSRNLGLQAEMFAKNPHKINRSYMNAKRNIEEATGKDISGLPQWLRQQSPIAGLGFQPDIPSMQYPSQVADMIDAPVDAVVSQTGVFKPIVEGVTGRSSFTHRDFKNDLTQWGPEGLEARKAAPYMQIPGMEGLLGLIPGVENVGGDVVWTDQAESAISSLNPWLGRSSNLMNPEKNADSAISMILGVRPVDVDEVYDNGLTPAEHEVQRRLREQAIAEAEKAELEELVRRGMMGS